MQMLFFMKGPDRFLKFTMKHKSVVKMFVFMFTGLQPTADMSLRYLNQSDDDEDYLDLKYFPCHHRSNNMLNNKQFQNPE